MHPDSCKSQSVFAGENREAARPAKGWFMPFRRRPGGSTGPPRGRRCRIRSSLRTFAAASLIACSLILHGCGGGGRAPVATPEGGGPAATLPPTPMPPPDPTPPTPQPPPPPPPPVSTPPPPPPAPPPPDAARFNIQSGDGEDAVERILESIDANEALKPYLGGHVLSYARYPRAVAAKPPPIRERHGLPATGTDFLDASGLAAMFASGIGNIFARDAGRGDGSEWRLTADVHAFSNWVDGVFFGTSIVGSTNEIAPFVLGVPSGVNPAGAAGTAVWTGSVTGREAGPVIGHLEGRATLTYDFEAANLDVVLDRLLYDEGGPQPQDVGDITWEDIPVSNGSFGNCSGSGNCIRGRFFDDNEGNAAESVGGVFRRGHLLGAFGAGR